jgi:hypothetical protein
MAPGPPCTQRAIPAPTAAPSSSLTGHSVPRGTGPRIASAIASLLVTLWTGRKATKRTFEMFCLYFTGWASAEEVQRHIEQLQQQDSC